MIANDNRSHPSKGEIERIFARLRSIMTHKGIVNNRETAAAIIFLPFDFLRKHRAISQRAGTARETSQSIPTIPMECPGLGERQSKSGRQATLVRQIQICQCKHHIQFFPLLHQPSVSRLSETEQSLDHRKNMLHLGTYR